MSFMYESMMSRGPGKRKIKVQEKNILMLMEEDDDDEEDRDFVLNEVKKEAIEESTSDSDETGETGTTSSCGSESSTTKDDSDSIQDVPKPGPMKYLSKHRRCTRQAFIPPTVQSTSTMIKTFGAPTSTDEILCKAKQQLKVSEESVRKVTSTETICCICLRKTTTASLISCKKCFISVHRDCFGGLLPSKFSKLPKSPWFCTACCSGMTPTCEFCPSSKGCFKATSNGQWCHVICARYILGKEMYTDEYDTSLIDLSCLNYKLYGTRECSLCDDSLISKTGICVKCDAGFCKSYFHVTCAQKFGLLSENETDNDCDTDPFFVYCPLHLGKEKMLKSQKMYLTAVAAVDRAKKEADNKEHEEKMSPLLKKRRNWYVRSLHRRFPASPIAGTPPARKLTSSAFALKALNRKAELLFGINVQGPGAYFPKPCDVRKRHHVAPALTGEFASHYADRELRIAEMQERIQSIVEENEELIKKQLELKREYEKLDNHLGDLQHREHDTVLKSRKLFSIFCRLKFWSEQNKASKRNSPHKRLLPLRPETRTLPPTDVGKKKSSPCRKRRSNEKVSEQATKLMKPPELDSIPSTSSSLLRKCSICQTDKEQHLLIDCDVCKRWLHLGCLDPPLSQLPKKSKFSLWQCSECVSTSSDEPDVESSPHGSLITTEGRRHTTRTHKPPEKYATSILHDQNLMRQKRMINRITRLYHNRATDTANRDSISLQTEARRPTKILRYGTKIGRYPRAILNRGETLGRTRFNIEDNERETSESNHTRILVKRETALEPSFGTTANLDLLRSLGKVVSKATERMKALEYEKPSTSSVGPEILPAISSPAKLALPVNSSLKLSTNASIRLRPVENVRLVPSGYKLVAKPSVADRLNRLVCTLKFSSANPIPFNTTPTSTQTPIETDGNLTVEKNTEKTVKKSHEKEDLSEKASSNACAACKTTDSVDKMMHCGSCKRDYHIWCCDPPLSNKPKMTRFFSWECSDCCNSPKDEKDLSAPGGSETTPDGRRKITRFRKPPEKFANVFYSSAQQKMLKTFLGRQHRPLKKRTDKFKKAEWRRRFKKYSTVLPSVLPNTDNEANEVKFSDEVTTAITSSKRSDPVKEIFKISRIENSNVGDRNSGSRPLITESETVATYDKSEALKYHAGNNRVKTDKGTDFENASDCKFESNEFSLPEVSDNLSSSTQTTVTRACTSTGITKSPGNSPSKSLVTVILPKPTTVKALPKYLTAASVASTTVKCPLSTSENVDILSDDTTQKYFVSSTEDVADDSKSPSSNQSQS